ncbi:hypothetical protein N9X46_08880 [Paracoccaceae bacterium]|nr:hypothetical protein [Paracoccaceae bacterium]MDB3922274.1 hypothetical protein [Paracoccaceae bacterium]MDC0583007.1 hypothetical protein [Paracoccaceae bacterium]MED7678832.1 hypothetical protein [Rhodobacteraceae bacterium IMCC15231]
MTRGKKICAFIEHYCLIPEDAQAGTQIKLMTLATQVGLTLMNISQQSASLRMQFCSVRVFKISLLN